MTKDRLNINNFKKYFKDKEVFETADIVSFYHIIDGQKKSTTVNWRIYSLIQKGVLQRVGHGKFSFGKSTIYIPETSPKIKILFNKIHNNFPFCRICVWHTSVFNEFMQHLTGKFFYLIEVEKDSAEAVFYFLKEQHFDVFLTPNQEILDKYLPENKDIYIVKPLVSESPTQKVGNIYTISLEKMLVDVFCEETLFATQQGSEMRTIFSEVLRKYTVNRSKMLRYADRRKKRTDFDNYLKTISYYHH
ncbi:MAG: hypothetical protein LBU83_08980 [Bacteroidales bacterium]|nr:hypothetical protein [Bacteroidales bacterium]